MFGSASGSRKHSALRPARGTEHLALPERPWAETTEDIQVALAVGRDAGLSDTEAGRRRLRYGPNTLRQIQTRHRLSILFEQFKSVVILLLLGAALLSFAFGDVLEGLAISAVIVVNTAIGFFTELRAVRSMEALRGLGRMETTVRRNGRAEKRPAEELVPGDIVLIEGGDLVTADLRLLEASKLQADESTLTGESAPVSKQTPRLDAATHLTERTNMLFKGTAVTRGAGEAVVVATGTRTELGQISALVERAQPDVTPLEKRLDTLGRRLLWITLVVTALVAVSGLVAGREALLAIEVAIALAVAAIPEGLPIVATIALARGMWRMAAQHALISKLSAVETLGATKVILADKTGTLTENRMTVTRIELADGPVEIGGTGLQLAGGFSSRGKALSESHTRALRELLTVAASCNNASVVVNGDGVATAVGDPTEVALLIAAAKAGIDRSALLEATPEIREEAFDPETKMMATINREDSRLSVAVKGAPEAVLEHCESVSTSNGVEALSADARALWLERADELGRSGLRTLALARKRAESEREPPYRGLTLLGIVGLLDPARSGVRQAIAACQQAGIRVVMVTGDHLATAREIALAVGLATVSEAAGAVIDARSLPQALADPAPELAQRLLAARVIARASPRQKLDLIELHQRCGHVVAMTGDGVNDAPALKKADIGIAMGVRGTQVAKDAAAMVLQDDEFSTIVQAVHQGRVIYENIRNFVVYLLSCNISEILIVGLASLGGAPLPLLPLQILFLNLVTDVFPALALGVGEGPRDVMRRSPRPGSEPILRQQHWWSIGMHGATITVAVLTAMYVATTALELGQPGAVTVSFLTLALAQVWHVLNMRAGRARWYDNEIVRNPWIWAAVTLCLALVIPAMYVPGMSTLLALERLAPAGWLVVVAFSLLPVMLGPLAERVAARIAGASPDRDGVPRGGSAT